jgi:Tfp pilus assembly PilM family ATPase
VRLGVELSGGFIRMVKLSPSSGRSRALEFKTVPLPGDAPDAPELSLVLRLALKDFLGRTDADVWAMVPAESADLRFLQVPKTGKKQLSNAIYWTAKKEAAFDESEVVFDYELQGEVMEKGAAKLAVMAYTVKREEFEKLRNLFLQAGYPLTGITVPSVAMRNLLRGGWVADGARTQACLHLGSDYSRLEIFGGGNLQLVRMIKGGLSSMAQALADASLDFTPPSPSPSGAEADRSGQAGHELEPVSGEAVLVVPEEPVFHAAGHIVIESMTAEPVSPPESETRPVGLSVEEARVLLESQASGAIGLPEGHPGRGLSPSDVLEMLKPAWERLLRQVQMTFTHHAVTLGNEQVSYLNLNGPFGADPGLPDYLGEKLGVPCGLLDPLAPENLGKLSVAAPALTMAQRQPYGLVLGLTGSETAACNLLHTYKQKEEEARAEGLNQMVALCWLGVALVIAGFFVWQQTQAYGKRQELAGLERKLGQFQPLVDMHLLLGTGVKVRDAVANLRGFASRNLASALLLDVTALTPENVKLYSISMDLGTPDEQPPPVSGAEPKPGQAAPAKKPTRAGLDTLTLEGYVTGDSQILESLLSAYLVRLRTSPLLGEPSVSKRSLESSSSAGDLLRFTLSCQVRR